MGKAIVKNDRNNVKSMVEGSPMKLMLAFMIPLLLGNIFQQAYSMVDGIIVGQILGSDALAAVGSSSSVQFLTLGLCIGACAGFAIPVSQRFGAKDEEGMRRYVYHSIILSAAIAIIMTVLTAVLCKKILVIMQTPEHIFDDAYAYLIVIFLGIPFSILYNMAAGIFRAVGNSRMPFVFLAVAAILNIVLDYLFIAIMNMGVAGAGIATLLSQAISGILSVIYIWKRVPQLHLHKEDRKWSWQATARLLGVGLLMGMQYSITAIGSMVMQSANNSLGGVYVSAFTAAGKLKQLFMSPFDAMSTALATFVGQNYGALRMDRAKKGLNQMMLLATSFGIVAGIVLILFGEPMSLLFLNAEDVGALEASAAYLKASGTMYWVLGILNIARNAIQALGFSARAVVAGVIEMIARTAMGLFLVPIWGYFAICWTDQAAWVTATIYLVITVIKVFRQRTNEVNAYIEKGQTFMPLES